MKDENVILIPSVIRRSVRGEIRAILRDENMRPVYDSDWFPNLITNDGMAQIARKTNADPFQYFVVGDGTTPPAFTDTELENQLGLAGSDYYYGSVDSNSGAPDYVINSRTYARFGPGNGTGTLTEFGAKRSNFPADDPVMVRQLLPAPVPKGVDQTLDVYYRLYIYPDLVDKTGVVQLEGVDYDYILRISNCDDPYNCFLNIRNDAVLSGSRGIYEGDIGPITGKPTVGWNANYQGVFEDPWDALNPWNVYTNFTVDLDGYTNNKIVRSIWFRMKQWGMQIQFDSHVNPGQGFPFDERRVCAFKFLTQIARH